MQNARAGQIRNSRLLSLALAVTAGSLLASNPACGNEKGDDFQLQLQPFVGGMSDSSNPQAFQDEFPMRPAPANHGAPSGNEAKSNPWHPIEPKSPAKKKHEVKKAESEDEEKNPDDSDDSEEKAKKKAEEEQKEKEKEQAKLPTYEDPADYLKRARFFTKHKQYKQALIDLNSALELKPDYWEARYWGAYVLQLQGRTNEAIAKYKNYLDVKPNDLHANINIGTLLRGRGEYEEAEKHYKKAIEADFYSMTAHYNLANVLIEQGKLEQALKELKVCLKLQPNNPGVHNNLGVVYQKRNYLEEAAEEFTRALTLEPANKTFERNLELVRGSHSSRDKTQTVDAADLL